MTWSPENRRRVARHTLLAVTSGVATIALAGVLPGHLRERISMATAYVAVALLAVTLVLGPLNVLQGRPNPVSFNRRRDFGIWAGIVGIFHSAIGLTVHLRGRMEQYFIPAPESRSIVPIRLDPFGAANYLGLASALVLILLLLLSSDLMLRRLGTPRWKRWQRWSYWAAGGIALHGVLYQLIENQRLQLILLFWVMVAGVAITQRLGFRSRRQS